MAVDLIITPAAQDIADAYPWYEARRSGLGKTILRCVDACIQTLLWTPGG